MRRPFAALVEITLLVICSPVGLAQTAAFVSEPPAKSSWRITYAYPDPGRNADGSVVLRPVAEVVQKAGDVRSAKVSWNNGSVTEEWRLGGASVTRLPEWPEGMLSARWMGPDGASEFGLHWIDQKYYVGTETLRGKECLVFEAPDHVADAALAVPADIQEQAKNPELPDYIREMVRSKIAEIEKAGRGSTRAWISAETRLPVQIRNGSRTASFEFGAGPDALQPPDAYAAELRKLQELYPSPPGARPN